jgi:tetratricopeptide (TPR) repeat protein/cytoskeletal protein CcmA (bactofilin family)
MDSYFEKGIILEGTLWIKGRVHFGASITGDVHSSDHFIISPTGFVKGTIHSYDISNSGKIEGDIFSKNKTILAQGGHLTGDITTYQLVIDEGSEFGGRCKMINASVEQRDAGSEVNAEKLSNKKRLLKHRQKRVPVAKIFSIVMSRITQLTLFIRHSKIARVFLIGFLIIGAFLFTNFDQVQINKTKKMVSMVSVGYAFLSDGNYEEAERVFKDILKTEKDLPRVYAGLGQVFYQTKIYQEAINQFKRSVDLMPSNIEYKLSLAKSYQSLGQLKDAEKYFQLAVGQKPAKANALYQYGLFIEEKGDFENAISHYRKALKIDKNLYEAHEPLGKILEKTGDFDGAIAEYSLALKNDKKNPALHLTLGRLLLNSNDSSKANFHFKRGLSLIPRDFKAHIKVADMLMGKDMIDKSLAFYEIASSIDPKNPKVYTRMGEAYLEKQDFGAALKFFKKLVILQPENAENQYQFGKLLLQAKDFNNARQALEKALSLRDNHPPTFYELGLALLEESNAKDAEVVFRKAVAGDSKNIFYSLALAKSQVINKKYNTALDRLLKILITYPKNAELQFSLCNVYSKKKFYTAAINHCESANNLTPIQDVNIMNRLAWLYAKKRLNLNRGINLMEIVNKAEPKNPKYIDTMSELLYAKGDVVEAVKTIREAIRLDPKNSYYRQQIWKFKNIPYDQN